jgi:hypothetical protein
MWHSPFPRNISLHLPILSLPLLPSPVFIALHRQKFILPRSSDLPNVSQCKACFYLLLLVEMSTLTLRHRYAPSFSPSLWPNTLPIFLLAHWLLLLSHIGSIHILYPAYKCWSLQSSLLHTFCLHTVPQLIPASLIELTKWLPTTVCLQPRLLCVVKFNFSHWLCHNHIEINTYQSEFLFFFFGGTRVWIQGCVLAKQALYCLSHTSSVLCFDYFWDRILLFT